MNVWRIQAAHTMSHMHAIQYAKGGQIPFSLFDGVAMSEEEAAAVQQRVNLKRALAEALAEAQAQIRGR